MDFYKILEYCELKAIQSAVSPTTDSIWRLQCRKYSKEYFTPLHEVVKLDPLFVLQALYEEKYRPNEIESELEGILENLYTIQDPNYTKISNEDMEELVDQVLNKEIKRLSKKKPTQDNIIAEVIEAESKPKQGSMNFDSSGSES